MRATFSYVSGKNSVVLISDELPYIDYYTGNNFYNYDDLAFDNNLWKRIRTISDGEIRDENFHLVTYKSDGSSVELPIIFDDKEIIYISSNYYENKISEVEKSRGLLFSSKDKMFRKLFLSNEEVSQTAKFLIPISKDIFEYIKLNDFDIDIFERDGLKNVLALDLIRYSVEQKKLGKLRDLFELSIDRWRDRLEKRDNDELYYYCRGLRLMISEYKNYVTSKTNDYAKPQKNLKIS